MADSTPPPKIRINRKNKSRTPRHARAHATDNAVFVCKSCNSSKCDRRLYEWFGLENRFKVPRIAEGKYLKLLYYLHERNETLSLSDVSELCPRCDLESKCPEKQKLTVYCLDGFCTKT